MHCCHNDRSTPEVMSGEVKTPPPSRETLIPPDMAPVTPEMDPGAPEIAVMTAAPREEP